MLTVHPNSARPHFKSSVATCGAWWDVAALDTPPSPTQPSHSHCQNQRFGSRQSPRKMPTSWKCTQGHLDRNRKTQLCLGGHFLGPLDSSPRVESHSQRVTEQCLIKQEPHSRDASGPEIISNCNWHSPRYSLFFFWSVLGLWCCMQASLVAVRWL